MEEQTRNSGSGVIVPQIPGLSERMQAQATELRRSGATPKIPDMPDVAQRIQEADRTQFSKSGSRAMMPAMPDASARVLAEKMEAEKLQDSRWGSDVKVPERPTDTQGKIGN
jgi:hypothetical protein